MRVYWRLRTDTRNLRCVITLLSSVTNYYFRQLMKYHLEKPLLQVLSDKEMVVVVIYPIDYVLKNRILPL